MATVSIHDAKTHLSRLLKRVEAGEEVVIARGRKPVAKLVPLTSTSRARRFGSMKGRVWLDDSFFEPLPEEELDAWEGR